MRLRVLSLNAWDLPFGLSRRARDRLNAIGDALGQYEADVVTFQEIWTQRGREQLLRAGSELGLKHHWHRPEAMGGSGLLVLSRLPIRDARFIRYRLGGLPQRIHHADYYGRKGLALLTLDTPAGPLALAVTHLHADYVDADAHDEYLGTRIAQIVELAHALLEVDAPIVATGDWNTQEGDDEYAALLGLTRLRDAAAALDARQDTILAGHPYHPKNHSSERIDMILTRDGRELRVRPIALHRAFDEPIRFADSDADDAAKGERYSDHVGLLAELEIEASEGLRTPDRRPRHAPDPDAIVRVERVLDAGIAEAQARQTSGRRWATAGVGLGVAGVGAWQSGVRERRDFISALLVGLSGVALMGALGSAWLSEGFGRDELAGFAAVRAQLDALRAAAETG